MEGIPFLSKYSSMTVFGRELYWNDIVFGLLFSWSLANLNIVVKYLRNNNQYQQTIFLFMLWGAVPLLHGWLNDNGNLFSDLRLFAWGLFGIVGPLGFKSFQQFNKFLKFYLFLHTIRLFYFFIVLITAFNLIGKFIDGRFDNIACTILITGIAIFTKTKTRYEKFLYYIVLPVSLFIVITDYTRTIYLEYLISIVMFIIFGKKIRGFKLRRFYKYITYGGVAVVLMILPLSAGIVEKVQERFGSIAEYQMDGSAMARIIAWDISIGKLQQSPLFGFGSGVDVGVHFPGLIRPMTPHNAYVQIAMWGGISTVLVFLIIQGLIIRRGIKESIRASNPHVAFLLLTCSIMATGFLFASNFTPTGGNGYFHFWYYATLVLIPLRLSKMSQ